MQGVVELEGEEARYASRWFWTLGQLAEACGTDESAVLMLIAAGCAPGPIYALDGARGWWSALGGGATDPAAAPGNGASRWYSPSAAWGLRAAILLTRAGASPDEAAEALRGRFERAFAAALARVDGAALAFPSCFAPDGRIEAAAAREQAGLEWGSWLDGGYAVCLRVFNADNCVAKEALAAGIKRELARPADRRDDVELLERCASLATLLLPFSPWERPTCTPGVTIDRLLLQLSLGVDAPSRP